MQTIIKGCKRITTSCWLLQPLWGRGCRIVLEVIRSTVVRGGGSFLKVRPRLRGREGAQTEKLYIPFQAVRPRKLYLHFGIQIRVTVMTVVRFCFNYHLYVYVVYILIVFYDL